jgi:hypothetical protein
VATFFQVAAGPESRKGIVLALFVFLSSPFHSAPHTSHRIEYLKLKIKVVSKSLKTTN